MLLACMLFVGSGRSEAAARTYIDSDNHSSQKALSAGKKKRVVVKRGTVRLARSRTNGTLTSRVYRTSTRFDTLVPSWNAKTPGPTWITVKVRVHSGGRWTKWFNLGVWASDNKPKKRRSVNGQRSGRWRVLTDTLQAKGPKFAKAYQYRVKLSSKKAGKSPRVRSLHVVSSNSYRHGRSLGVRKHRKAWGKVLGVPRRTQMVYPQGEAWCSPTSMSMVTAYWAKKTGRSRLDQWPKSVARGVRDYSYGWGNWSFNTAYAGSRGLDARVGRLGQIEQIESRIKRGIPVIASISWDNSKRRYRLSGAPLRRSNGHLLVVRGFTKSGNVIVNDPAARKTSKVRRVYKRGQFERAWLRNGANRYKNYGTSGIVYLIKR
ncbi:MAG: peptidase C39 family protein [Rubrobacteraceae bacterium]